MAFRAVRNNDDGQAGLLNTLFNTPGMLIAHLDRSFNFIRVNRAYARADNKPMSFFPGRNLFDLYPDEENRRIFKRVVRTGKPYQVTAKAFEYARNPERGVSNWDWSLQPLKKRGKVTGLVLTLQDVTARVRTDAALKWERDRAQTYLDLADVIFITLDTRGRIRMINRMGCTLLERKEAELLGRSWFTHCLPARARRRVRGIAKRMLSGESEAVEFVEDVIATASGKERLIAWHNTVLTDAGGNVTGLLSTGQDITDRHEAVLRLRESEERYRTLVTTAPYGIQLAGTDGRIVFCNPAFHRMYGAGKGSLNGMHVWDLQDTPKARKALKDQFRLLVKKQPEPTPFFGRERTRDDRVIDSRVDWAYVRNADGALTGIISIITDITAQKLAERRLERSERNYRELVEHAGSIILRVSGDGTVLFINDFAQRLFGYPQKDIAGKNMVGTIIPPKSDGGHGMEWLFAGINRDPERYSNYEGVCVGRDGSRVWVSWSFRRIQDAAGAKDELLCIGNDITATKKSLDAQLKAALLWQTTFDSMNEAICFIGMNGLIMKANRSMAELMRMDPDEIIGAPCYRLFHNADGHVEGCLMEKIRAGAKRAGREIRVRDTRQQLTAAPVTDDNGRLVGVVHVMTDVTEQRRAAEALAASEEKYRLLFRNMSNGFALHRIVTDIDGRPIDYVFLEMNDAFETMTGINPAQALGKPASRVLPGIENDPTDWIGRYGRVALTGRDQTFESYSAALHRWYSVHAYSPRKGLFATVFEDISDRKEGEMLLQASEARLRSLAAHLQTVREEERGTIAREIHDELGQLLTAFKMDVSWLHRHLPDAGRAVEGKLEGMTGLIDRVIGAVKRISAQLRPSLLDDLGLLAAMEWQADEFKKHAGLAFRFRRDVRSDIRDPAFGTAVFRVFQEALTNIARHADATRASASVTEKNGMLKITVRDNGKGMDPGLVDAPDSYGLLGMQERMAAVGGRVVIRPRAGGGTEVVAEVPVITAAADED